MSVRTRNVALCVILLFARSVIADSGTPGVESRADTLLRNMSDYLKTASEFSFRVEVDYDQVLDSGQKILYGRRSEVALRRPDGLHVLINGDLINERMWYDGKTFVLLDLTNQEYGKISVPSNIDDALDFLARKYGISSPVADVLYSDPYKILTEKLTTGIYVGNSTVRGIPTHHLAFTQDNIDWQLWIEDGARPVPRKALITYKNVTSSPQITMWLSNWNFAPRLADSLFEFLPPENAKQVEIKPLAQ